MSNLTSLRHRGAKVIESVRWRCVDGRTASMWGAVPWAGGRGRREGWTEESMGFTIRWGDGTVGIGRVPFPTREEAETYLRNVIES